MTFIEKTGKFLEFINNKRKSAMGKQREKQDANCFTNIRRGRKVYKVYIHDIKRVIKI